MGQCWLVLGGTGAVLGSPGWFVVVMGQYGAVLVSTWWYWVGIGLVDCPSQLICTWIFICVP